MTIGEAFLTAFSFVGAIVGVWVFTITLAAITGGLTVLP